MYLPTFSPCPPETRRGRSSLFSHFVLVSAASLALLREPIAQLFAQTCKYIWLPSAYMPLPRLRSCPLPARLGTESRRTKRAGAAGSKCLSRAGGNESLCADIGAPAKKDGQCGGVVAFSSGRAHLRSIRTAEDESGAMNGLWHRGGCQRLCAGRRVRKKLRGSNMNPGNQGMSC